MKFSSLIICLETAALLTALPVRLLQAGDLASDVPRSTVGLKAELLAQDWSQCEGRFHYTFLDDGRFTLDGTLLGGTWTSTTMELVLEWSGSAIVDHLEFDRAGKSFRHSKGRAFDILHAGSSKLATAGR